MSQQKHPFIIVSSMASKRDQQRQQTKLKNNYKTKNHINKYFKSYHQNSPLNLRYKNDDIKLSTKTQDLDKFQQKITWLLNFQSSQLSYGQNKKISNNQMPALFNVNKYHLNTTYNTQQSNNKSKVKIKGLNLTDSVTKQQDLRRKQSIKKRNQNSQLKFINSKNATKIIKIIRGGNQNQKLFSYRYRSQISPSKKTSEQSQMLEIPQLLKKQCHVSSMVLKRRPISSKKLDPLQFMGGYFKDINLNEKYQINSSKYHKLQKNNKNKQQGLLSPWKIDNAQQWQP